jgi:predicted esterase
MEQWLESVRKEPGHTSRSTAKFLAKELSRGRKGTSFEIDLPWNRLLRDFEQIAVPNSTQEASETGAFGEWVSESGWKWMQLSREKSTQVVRMEVPEYDAKDSELKLPLLIALHGAGGSENMFFQTYGAGRLIELGRQRRWIVVSPRQTMAGLGMDLGQMVEALSEILPVDRTKVMLVGHSMGAAQAMTQVSKHPERVRGVAALGGGGGVIASEAIRKVPFYIGAGDRDFGKSGAKRLSQQLERLGCEVEYREYRDVEHMVIVQAALDDVFAFFDQRLR